MSDLKQNRVVIQLDFHEIMDREDVESISLACQMEINKVKTVGGEDSKMHAG